MFRCAWVCINMLRRFGCELPVEMWTLNDSELTLKMKSMIEPLGVEVINAARVRRRHPARILNAWELKPFALVHSRFEEVILLDADNVPLIDPEVLFSRQAYSKFGCIFWPDEGRFAEDHPIWRICKLEYRNEPQFESGPIVVNKSRCWKAICSTTHLNDHSDFYYRYVHGDKDTFHLAWRLLDQNFGLVPIPMKPLRGAMCQHDFNGRRFFQHRNFLKWDRESNPIPGFRFEKDCLLLLAKLDRKLAND
jgi:Mannosyltransferase putative